MEQQISVIIPEPPRIIAPVNAPALSPEEFAKGHNTVTMVFEKPVLFTPSHGVRVSFTKGVHEVPKEYKDHWYLVAHGAYPYTKPIAVSDKKKK